MELGQTEAPPVEEERDDKRIFPFELSQLIQGAYSRLGVSRVYALNSKDGSLLSAFDPAYRFGVQLEEQRAVANGAHARVQGDLALAARLLANVNAKADHAIVDLSDQEDPTPLLLALDVLRDGLEREAEESAVKNYSSSNVLTTFVVHPEREAQVLEHPAFGKRVFAIVKAVDAGVTVIFTGTNLKAEHFQPAQKNATEDVLDLLPQWVEKALRERVEGGWYCLGQALGSNNEMRTLYTAVHREIGRRTMGRDLPPEQRFDVSLQAKTLNVLPSDYAKKMIEQQGKRRLREAHGKNVSWLAKNLAAWEEMQDLERLSALEIDPEARPTIEAAVADAVQIRTPNYQLPPAMRLGYLIGKSSILCTKTAEGFERGRLYPLRYRTDVPEKKIYYGPEPDKYGVEVEVYHERRLKAMELTIGHRSFRDTEAADITFIVDHFDLPDPGDQATLFPERVAENLALLEQIEEELITPNLKRIGSKRTKLFDYQKGDLARVLCKPSMLLAWEQGLGKTCAGATLIEAYKRLGAENRVLIVVPGDLVKQWQRELRKFTGREATILPRKQRANEDGEEYAAHILAEMRDLGRRMARGEADGIYLITYEGLSLKGQSLASRDDTFIHHVTKVKKQKGRPATRRPDGTWDRSADEFLGFEWHWVLDQCPRCRAPIHGDKCHAIQPRRVGRRPVEAGRGEKGTRCGWSRKTETPTIADLLAPGFKDGVVIIDEGTRIANISSQRTQAVMKLKARNKLILTGTPIKNYVGQAFPLLLWCFGPNSPMFEFPWHGLSDWTNKFEVKEAYKSPDDQNVWKYRTTGEITNLSELYLTLAVCSMRLTKEDTGEKIVPIKTHVLEAPRGVKQTEQIAAWADQFGDWFRAQYPDHPLSKMGEAKSMSAFLGLHKKWEWACSLPTGDPHHDFTGVEVSDWTPMMFKTLETTLKLVKLKRKVIVGTFHRDAGTFIEAALTSKGVKAHCIVGATPAQRASAVEAFQEGDTEVLVSTIKALSQGHDIAKARAVVCHGLDWAYDVYFQFIARAHRVSSENPVDVFVTLPGTEGQSVFGRIWRSLQDKAKGVASALDGVVEDLDFDQLSPADVTKQLLEQGVEADGTEVPEKQVERAWRELPSLQLLKVDQEFEESLSSWADHDPDAPLRRRAYVNPMVTHGDVASMLEGLWNRLRQKQINGAITIGDAIDQAFEREDTALKAWMALPDAEQQDVERPALGLRDLAHAVVAASALKPVEEIEPADEPEAEEEPVDEPDKTPEPEEAPEKEAEGEAALEPENAPDAITAALMQRMEEMQAQMDALKRQNEELEKKLTEDTQMSLFGEVAA